MASIKLYLDTRKARNDGTYPLKLSIHHKGKFMINLKIYLKEDQFDPTKDKPVTGHKSFRVYNEVITRKLAKAQYVILNTPGLLFLSNNELKALIEGDGNKKDNEMPAGYKMSDHLKICIKEAKTQNTADLFDYARKKVLLYSREVTFEEITISWLDEFETWLLSSLSVNSTSIILRNIRTAFLDARKKKLILKDCYPFDDFTIKDEETRKRSLKAKELVLIRDWKVEKHQEVYRDYFMLVFYLIGINMIDLCNLTEIRDGRIEYDRSKTKRKYSIKVPPEAMTIIEKYRGKNYLLDVKDRYINYKDFVHRMNENLQKIGFLEWTANNAKDQKNVKRNKKVHHPFFPDLTVYWARHTWATIASNKCKISSEDIALALGHGKKTTTDIYIDYDLKRIDRANRKVLKYIKESACINPYYK